MHRSIIAALTLLAALTLPALAARACDIDRPIEFAGLDYDSARFHNAVAMAILKDGYGCKVDALPGQVIPLLTGLARGDVDIIMEVWTANPAQAWTDAEKAGSVVRLGVNFPDARQGWFVPRYLVEGPNAKARGLKSVTDLPRFKSVFRDPEEPDKGRFLDCPAGWECEVVNSKKLAAYGLSADYTNFRSGTGEALAAAVESAVKRKRPVLFYYWGPTWLLGKYDFVALEEPPFDKAVWDRMMAAEQPQQACAYPQSEVVIGANKAFADKAPNIVAFLKAYRTTSALVSAALAHMREHDAKPADAARWFLRTKPEVWTKWVPAEVAARVKAAL